MCRQNRTDKNGTVNRSKQIRTDQIRAEQIRTEQNRLEQNRTDQIRSDQIRSEQNRSEQNRTEQNRTEQNRTEQNRTEQSRTEQNQNRAEQSRQNRKDQNRTAIASWSPYTNSDGKKDWNEFRKMFFALFIAITNLPLALRACVGIPWEIGVLLISQLSFASFTLSCGRHRTHILEKISPYQHFCCIVSLIASFFSIKSPIFAVFIHISLCFFCVLVQLLSVRLCS